MPSALPVERRLPLTASAMDVPAVRSGVIPRERLAPLREAAQGSRVVLISAPAGYGKSTVAAEWARLDPRDVGWVRLGQPDNDPVVLLNHIAAALEQVGPIPEDLRDELSRQTPRIDEVALPLLAAALSECGRSILVLDDVHVITAEKGRAILTVLADHVPSGSQVMLVTRGDPGVPLGRLRTSGDLVEVDARLLALDTEETRAVAASGGLELTDEAAEALRERTEGWAAAVVLAALSLRDREDGAARVASLVGNQAQIADYLLEEVLRSQPDKLAAFLLGSSILDRMSAPLCGAVLGVADAADSLDALARSNAFVIPLDDRREWYRYHHLLGDFLRAELERRHPELYRLYLARAASWCEVHGSPDEAFAYAHECGDLAQAGRIALANQARFTQRGQSETMRLWLDGCTDENIASDPQLSIAAAWVFLYQGDEARARRSIAAAERGPLDVPSADGATSLRSALACVRAAVAPDGIPRMLRDAELVCASEKNARTRWYFSGARALGTAYVLLGRPQEAIAPLREVISSHHPELPALRIMSLAYLAFAAWELGNRRDAHRWAVQSTMAVADEHLEETAYSAIASTGGAVAHLERGDHTAATRQLENVRRLRPLLGAARWVDVDLALRCADVSLDLGDRPGAVELTRIAGDALQGYPDAGALPSRLQRLEERIRLGTDFGLTSAELRLIHFLPTHLSLQEIADRLYLSRATVKTEVASIYAKLGVPGRSEAVDIVEQSGLGSSERPIVTPAAHSD
jgi:LuxR family maltose regulon positive regulatory protein